MKNIKLWLLKLKPRIHFLKDVIYINWLGMEWFIPKKLLNRNSIGKHFVGAKVDRLGEILSKSNIKHKIKNLTF